MIAGLVEERRQRLQEKLKHLYRDYDLETRSEEKLRLQAVIDDTEKALEQFGLNRSILEVREVPKNNNIVKHAYQPSIIWHRWRLIVLFLSLLGAVLGWYVWNQNEGIQVGKILLQQGEYKQAHQECLAAPLSSARDQCLRISSLMLEQRGSEAFEAIAQQEDSAYALTVMAEVEASRGDFAAAEKHYQEAIKSNPAVAQAYFGMGQVQQLQNLPDKALAWYLQAVEQAPNNRRFLLNLASSYAELNKFSEAEQRYRKVLTLDSSILLAYVELIDVLKKQQKTAEARQLAQAAQQGLALHPDWKDEPLNQDVWFVMQDGKPTYLENWEDKQAYLFAQFEKAGTPL